MECLKHPGFSQDCACPMCFQEYLDGYPVKDEIWPSRFWNEAHTDFIDLSGEAPDTCGCKACQDVCPVCESRYKAPDSQLCEVCGQAATDDLFDHPSDSLEEEAGNA